MFGFGNKKTIEIENEASKLDSMISYLNDESSTIYQTVINGATTQNEKTALQQNRDIAFKTYGELGMDLLKSCDNDFQEDFLNYFNKKSNKFQNKMHTLIGSSIVLAYLRSSGSESPKVYQEHINQILNELQSVYENQ